MEECSLGIYSPLYATNQWSQFFGHPGRSYNWLVPPSSLTIYRFYCKFHRVLSYSFLCLFTCKGRQKTSSPVWQSYIRVDQRYFRNPLFLYQHLESCIPSCAGLYLPLYDLLRIYFGTCSLAICSWNIAYQNGSIGSCDELGRMLILCDCVPHYHFLHQQQSMADFLNSRRNPISLIHS